MSLISQCLVADVADVPISHMQAGLLQKIFKPYRHVMVWNPKTSPWLPPNMIHVGNFHVKSRRLSKISS